MKKGFLFFCFGILISPQGFAQINVRDSLTQGFLLGFGAGIHLPGGDLADKFGTSIELGFDTWYKTRSNWMFGLGGSYFFGDNIKIADEIVEGIATSTGQLIDLNGNYADYKFFERGFTVLASGGKIFNQFGHNPNSGLVILVGAGYIQHKIRIENAGQNLPQLLDEYTKGYDRLSGGLLTRQFIGYMHAGNRKRLNFLFGFDFMQGFTENYRGVNYDSGVVSQGIQSDYLYGLKFIWFIPIYDAQAQTYFYR